MLSFILWIIGCAVATPAIVYIFNKIMKGRAVKNSNTMTKDRYNTIAERLLIITLLSTFVCIFVNSYMPLIITGAAFVGFLVYARKRYGYRAVESRKMTEDEIDLSHYYRYNPNADWHPMNIYSDDK